jgi:hypothetical protein
MNHSFQPKITKNYLYYRPHELWRRSLSLLTDTYPILIYNPIGVITVLKVEFQILGLFFFLKTLYCFKICMWQKQNLDSIEVVFKKIKKNNNW